MAWTAQVNESISGLSGPTTPISTNPANLTNCTVLVACIAAGAGLPVGAGSFVITPGSWVPLRSVNLGAEAVFTYVCLSPPLGPAVQFFYAPTTVQARVNVRLFGFGGHAGAIGPTQPAWTPAAASLAVPAVFAAATSLVIAAAAHQDPVGNTLAAPGTTTLLQGNIPFLAAGWPGLSAYARIPASDGSVVCTFTNAGVVAEIDAIAGVIDVAQPVVSPFIGTGPILNLPGKVNGSHQLLVSIASLGDDPRTARVESDTALTDAVLIPPPPPGLRVVVTQFSASALVAGAFRVWLTTGGVSTLGPFWLPGVGPVGLASARNAATGPIARALPPGQGLEISTSAAAPQAFDVAYVLVPEGI